jgi:hypothetical protein
LTQLNRNKIKKATWKRKAKKEEIEPNPNSNHIVKKNDIKMTKFRKISSLND